MNTPYQSPPPLPQRSWISRNWLWMIPIGCLGPVLLCGGFITVIALSVFGMIKSIGPYDDSLVTVQQDVNAIENMGEPIEAGFVVQGNVHISNGEGSADFSYPVSGPKGGGWVSVVATKKNGEWETESLTLESNGAKFDLLVGKQLVSNEEGPEVLSEEAEALPEDSDLVAPQ